jgi:hypothetical protein
MAWYIVCCIALCVNQVCQAQLTVGAVEGSIEVVRGAVAGVPLDIQGPTGSAIQLKSDARGRYFAVVPYGVYTVRAISIDATCRVRVVPLQVSRCDLLSGKNRAVLSGRHPVPGAYNAAQQLLFLAPAAVTEPLDFAGLGNIRLPLISFEASSWTETGFRLNGMDVTDSYQPGRPVLLDDAAADEAVLHQSGPAVAIYLRGPERLWHGGLATEDTGSALTGDNLPAPPDRGLLQRSSVFHWFTRDTAQLSGPLSRWADLSLTGAGQWASQSAPLRSSGTPIGSRILLGNVQGAVRVSSRDRATALYSGSRLDLSNDGWPAAFEPILASRIMPTFYGVDGFENLRETDHLDVVQAGWTHQFNNDRTGVLEARYQYSTAHLNTAPTGAKSAPSSIDLLDPARPDAPLSNLAIRTRHEFEVAYQSGEVRFLHMTHRYAVGAGWEEAQPRNRFQIPFGTDLITVSGQPAFVVRFNAPANTRARVRSSASYAADIIRLAHGISLDLRLGVDHANGEVSGGPVSISWTNPSPRLGIAAPIPRLPRIILRGSYGRTYSRLAGRFLDFADPHSLGAVVYSADTGAPVQRFGGAYSDVVAGLKRPYADEFRLSADFHLPGRSAFSVTLARRDEKNRMAAINTGVPDTSYQPVPVMDPGGDFKPGTFDDQTLVLYKQDPSSLAQDHYTLSNPAGLRALTEAITAEASTRYGFMDFRASFTAEKSFGPTNPGNSAWVNDPGIVGALYSDPNTLIHAAGHPFIDRAFIGKFQAVAHLPQKFGGLELISMVNYLDGLPFARRLLVTGFPQGPFLVDATIRGSPEGGHRAEYVLNWNLRISRDWPVSFGQLRATADILNVLNNGNKIIENDLSGPQFNDRPALGVPPPRMLRLGLRWIF